MNKAALISKILSSLRHELTVALQATRASVAAATDGDSKAENKYDTRNLEASYLARGQGFRVADLQAAVTAFEDLEIYVPPTRLTVGIGALVRLQTPAEDLAYFIGPAAGGTEVLHEGQEVLVTTPASPLGTKLMGCKVGETFELRLGWRTTVLHLE